MNFNQFIYKKLNYLFMIPNTSSCKFDAVKLVMHVTLNKVKYHSSQKKKKRLSIMCIQSLNLPTIR